VVGEPEPDEYLAARDENGQLTAVGSAEVGALGRETLKWQAAVRRATEVKRRDGAQARAGLYPRGLTRELAEGVVNLMFAKILNGEIEPRTAKEAAEVAKMADEIARRHSGEAAKPELAGAEREQLTIDVKNLTLHLHQRAAAAQAQLPDDDALDVRSSEAVPAAVDAPGYAPHD
jgi:hypothetical protein